MGTLLAFFATGTGQTAMVAAALWALGCFGKSAWYEKFREALGRGAEAAGVAVSALGNSKLKLLWDPIERVICDFAFFAVEQFAVGLRKDNPEKMERQLDRLEEVGSQSRADALAKKLEALAAIPPPPTHAPDAEVLAQAVAAGEAATERRLGE